MAYRTFMRFYTMFFGEEDTTRSNCLYQLLDVDPSASPAVIKRAFRTKSLLLHPDKMRQRRLIVTDEDTERFLKMRNAYNILSNPRKRQLYDQLGESGMTMMEDPFAAMDNIMERVLRMKTVDRLKLVLFVVLFVGAVLLWPVLFCAKVDGETSASWMVLWTPLWVYDALGLWYFMYLVSLGRVGPAQDGGYLKDPFSLPMRVFGLAKWVLLIIFQIFVALRLDGDIDWSYAVVGSPLLVWVGLGLLVHIYERTWTMGEDILWIIQLAFLIVRLDNQVGWSWWLVFLPTWVLLFGKLAGYCLEFSSTLSLAVADANEDEASMSEEVKARLEASAQRIVNTMGLCCCWACTSVSVCLAVNAIAGAGYSAFVIFIPLFIVAGLLLCCTACMTCFIRAQPNEDRAQSDEDLDELLRKQHGDAYNTFDPSEALLLV